MDGYDFYRKKRNRILEIIQLFYLGFYLFHESMLESVIYARDHFLHLPSPNDDITPDPSESIIIFPSHAYLVCY